MNINIAKYEFDSKKQFDNKLKALVDVKFAKVELGNIVLKKAVYKNNKIVTDQVLSTNYHVDIIWYGLDKHPKGWKSYYVDIQGNGSHSFAGLDYNDYKF